MLTFIDEYGGAINLEIKTLLLFGLFCLGLVIAFYLLRSVGLYKLATRHKIERAVLSFVPCLWIYVACKLIGEVRFLNKNFNKLSVVLTIVYTIANILIAIANILWYFPVVGYVLTEGANAVITIPASDIGVTVGELYWTRTFYVGNTVTRLVYPYSNLNLVYKVLTTLDLINTFFDIVIIFITISIYISLFRKFWPQHYLLATIFSVLGLFPLFVFIIRKNKAVRWSDYARSRYVYYTVNPNPYQNDTDQRQSGNQSNYQSRGNDSPFGEFFDKKPTNEEPFSEFFDDKK